MVLPDEASGFAAEPGYVTDLERVLSTFTTDPSTDRTMDLVADVAITQAALREAEAEIHRLEDELKKTREDLEQAARLVPGPGEVVVSRQDLRDLLTVVALHAPVEFRPSVVMDRLVAAAGDQP